MIMGGADKWSSALLVLLVLSLCGVIDDAESADQPNIVVIVADDLGWNDLSFHGSDQIPTPNIDALAYNGIILNSHYVQPLCTPSRAALLTGKYPIRLGLQGQPLLPAEPAALPPEKLMPEYFKDLGYRTHMIGKWHLGYARWNDTPTHRGFDHHFGYFNGWINYYDYLTTRRYNETDYTGFDLRRDHEPAWDVVGEYATRSFTKEAVRIIDNHDVVKPLFLYLPHLAVHAGNEGKLLEAPQETVDKFKHIVDSNRRTYAAMVSELDDSVGAIVESLGKNNMLQNSVIVFLSDNGAPSKGEFYNWGSNHPLRGVKDTLFEGGVRSASLIWSPLIVQNARVSTELMHITDWLPTLYSAAGGGYEGIPYDLDGQDQWSSLVYDLPSARSDALLNINELSRNAALRFNNWKLVVGLPLKESDDGYFGESGERVITKIPYNISAVSSSPAGKAINKVSYTPVSEQEFEVLRDQATLKCLPLRMKKNACNLQGGEVCLYDVPNDPCEENNLAPYFPAIVRRLKQALVEYRKGMVPQINQEPDIEKDDPKLFQYTWNPWLDCGDLSCSV